MMVKTSVTVVIISDSGKEVSRTTGKASSTFSSGVDKAHQEATVGKVIEQASSTASKAVAATL